MGVSALFSDNFGHYPFGGLFFTRLCVGVCEKTFHDLLLGQRFMGPKKGEGEVWAGHFIVLDLVNERVSLNFNAFIQKDVQTGLWHWHNHQDRASDETKNILMAAQRGRRLLVVSEYCEYALHFKVTTCSVKFWSEICVSTGIFITVLYLLIEITETLGIMYNLYFIYNLFMKCICSSVFCMWCFV